MGTERRGAVALATMVAVALATLVVLADTDRITPLLVFVHAVPLGDKLGHLVLIGLLALVVELATAGRVVSIARAPIRIGSAVVLALVVLEEISQRWVPARSFDYGDLAADVIGIAVLGTLGARLARQRARTTGAAT
ncbi:VanZ family protein [Sandaracinus amylolyticus]|uniref:VanZ-like domain-containing protein n=1 Tax=Sandaracinus amylolyticus TaxID=927083 RepID=A0A0F6W9E6_9BACT|nr:VanZ family protein [Sandaracinus amylolyticus]AKF10715.1 hypothetical protein DB32_007864 [Sandaracinus amylolyticus]